MATLRVGNYTTTLAALYNRGLRYSTVIDIGCGDGSFYLDHLDKGLFAKTKPLHIEANKIYETSLREIKEVVGGDYVIAAVDDQLGDIELTQSAHPYWASTRPATDPYWDRINGLRETTTKVPGRTLDDIVQSSKLPGPYLLKMDIQGAEEKAIVGGAKTLTQTDVVIVEADIDDFQAINAALIAANFSLFDLTSFGYTEHATLGWFYPVYLNNRRSDLKAQELWSKSKNAENIELQHQRRKAMLQTNAFLLSKFRQVFK